MGRDKVLDCQIKQKVMQKDVGWLVKYWHAWLSVMQKYINDNSISFMFQSGKWFWMFRSCSGKKSLEERDFNKTLCTRIMECAVIATTADRLSQFAREMKRYASQRNEIIHLAWNQNVYRNSSVVRMQQPTPLTFMLEQRCWCQVPNSI